MWRRARTTGNVATLTRRGPHWDAARTVWEGCPRTYHPPSPDCEYQHITVVLQFYSWVSLLRESISTAQLAFIVYGRWSFHVVLTNSIKASIRKVVTEVNSNSHWMVVMDGNGCTTSSKFFRTIKYDDLSGGFDFPTHKRLKKLWVKQLSILY